MTGFAIWHRKKYFCKDWTVLKLVINHQYSYECFISIVLSPVNSDCGIYRSYSHHRLYYILAYRLYYNILLLLFARCRSRLLVTLVAEHWKKQFVDQCNSACQTTWHWNVIWLAATKSGRLGALNCSKLFMVCIFPNIIYKSCSFPYVSTLLNWNVHVL